MEEPHYGDWRQEVVWSQDSEKNQGQEGGGPLFTPLLL